MKFRNKHYEIFEEKKRWLKDSSKNKLTHCTKFHEFLDIDSFGIDQVM